jgi:hypothetical protein
MSFRRSKKTYIGPINVLPKYLTSSEEFRALSGNATKLLIAVLPQFNGRGRNNGGLMILVNDPHRYGFTRARRQ